MRRWTWGGGHEDVAMRLGHEEKGHRGHEDKERAEATRASLEDR